MLTTLSLIIERRPGQDEPGSYPRLAAFICGILLFGRGGEEKAVAYEKSIYEDQSR
jgi:hypothetical protein